jgi:hypothetical protein
MKIFKPESMMQEHRQHQASQRGDNRIDGKVPSTNFEVTLKLLHDLK